MCLPQKSPVGSVTAGQTVLFLSLLFFARRAAENHLVTNADGAKNYFVGMKRAAVILSGLCFISRSCDCNVVRNKHGENQLEAQKK